MMLDVQSRLASPNRYQVFLGLSLLYVRGFLQRYLGKVITVDATRQTKINGCKMLKINLTYMTTHDVIHLRANSLQYSEGVMAAALSL
jgi:hypothetical protein